MNPISKTLSLTVIALSLSVSAAFSQISFTMSVSQGCVPLSVTFTNTSAVGSAYYISFDDGSGDFLVGTDTTHVYNGPGYYNIYLYVYDSLGAYIGFASDNLQVDAAETNFYQSATSVCPGTDVQFNAQFNGSSFFWDFGDGDTASGQWTSHIYATLDTFYVTLVTNGICGIDSIVQSISVDSTGASNANFGFWPDPVCPFQPVTYYPFDQSGASFIWDFGDGDSSTTAYPTNAYDSVGFYNITFIMTNGCGNSDTVTNQIEVKDNAAWPPLNLSFYESPACPQQEIHTDAPGGYLAYVWDAGDGSPVDSTGENWIDHSYSDTGFFIQTVKIYNYCGGDTTISDTVEVSMSVGLPNQPGFEVQMPDTICPGESVNINLPGGFMSYVIDYGDGSPIDSLAWMGGSVYHTYADSGTLYFSAKIYNFCGNDSTIYDSIVVDANAPFQPDVQIYVNSPVCPGGAVFSGPAGQALYVWDYGDGSPLDSITKGDQTAHNYADTGSYSLTLTIVNFCGNDTTLYATLVVGNNIGFPMNMGVNPYPSPVCPDDRVSLNADPGYASYDWDFGDGFTITTGDNWTDHYYDSLGAYNISVTITNGCGLDTTLTGGLLVDSNAPMPTQIQLNVSSSTACPGDAVSFNIYDDWDLFFWNFGGDDTITNTLDYMSYTFDSVGTYEVYVTVYNGCGNQRTLSTTIVVDSNNAIVSADMFALNDNVCPGDIISIGPDGDGEGNNATSFLYYWDLGDGTLDTTQGTGVNHSYDSAGVYTVTTTAFNSCGFSATSTLTITVTDSALPSLGPPGGDGFFGVANEGAFAGCPGDAILFFFAGQYTNTWDFGDGSSGSAVNTIQTPFGAFAGITHVYQDTGSYWAKLTITNGCGNSITDSVFLVIGSGLAVDGEFFAESPPGGGSFTTCQGVSFLGMGGSSYTWDYGDGEIVTTTSSQVTHFYDSAGTYTVTLLITNSCGNTGSYSQVITVIDGGGATATAVVSGQLTCNGSSDAVAMATGTGGSLPYTYTWSDPAAQTTASAGNLSAGTYSVTVSDMVGCSGVTSVTISDPPALTGTGSMTPASCAAADGTVSITSLSGGTAPYTFVWSNGDTSSTADSLASGTYTVTVTDANSCVNTQNVTLNDVSGVTLTNDTVVSATCNGGSDGYVNLTASGGTTPYTFIWSNGDTIEDISGLKEGTYTVTVTDAAGCKTIQSGTITEPDAIALATTIADANCGIADGSIAAVASGGTAGYSYLWSNGDSSAVISSLVAGGYNVTITDANSCAAVYTVTVSNANAPAVTSIVTNVSCNGAADGAIDLSVSGGTTPYTYLWLHDGSFTQDVSGLSPSSITVILYDGGGCQTARTFNITEPDALVATLSTTAEHCNSVDGTVTATVTGGTTAYTYAWSSGGSASTESGLVDGSYIVTVTDANACTTLGIGAISDVAGPTASISDSSMVLCFGNSNGDATVLGTAGTGTYTYTWDDSGAQTNAQATGLIIGTYKVILVDSAGCSDSANVTITEPAVLLASISDSSNISCFSFCDGNATVSVVGGTTPYTYAWDDPGTQTDSAATGLCDDTVNVTVTDFNGCVAGDGLVITQPMLIVLSSVDTNISCAGGNNGSIDLTISGGTTPYAFNWSGSDTTEDVSGLIAGTYQMIVTDANGCMDSISVNLTEESPLVLTQSNVDAHCQQTDGSSSILVSGGVTPYVYLWDDPGAQTSANAAGLSADTYTIIVTDSFGCTATDSITIATTVDSISICVVTVDSISSMNVVVWDKPGTGLGISSINVYRDIIGVYTLVGNVPYTDFSQFQDTSNGINPNATSYRYKISIVDSCGNEGTMSTYHETVNLVPVTISGGNATLIWDNYEGFNFAFYRILLDSTGGSNFVAIDSVTNANFTYVDLNAPIAPTLNYRIEVVTASICIAEKGKNFNSSKSNTSSVGNYTAMSSGVTSSDVTQGNCDGTATITVSDGLPPYTYLWNDSLSQTTANATGLCPGNYSVTVIDATGDSITETVTIGTKSGFEEFDLNKHLVIYPNPNAGHFSILITAPDLDLVTLKVFTVEGALIMEKNLPGVAGELREDLDISNAGPGVYYIQIISAHSIAIKKVIVQ